MTDHGPLSRVARCHWSARSAPSQLVSHAPLRTIWLVSYGRPATPESSARRRLFPSRYRVGSSLALIDGSVVNIALPAIQQALHADAASTQWIVNAYLLLLGALVLVGGSAADLYGRRRIFLVGIAV